MPIGGVVISSVPEKKELVLKALASLKEVEVHGADEAGNIVAVLDTTTSEEMERVIDRINKDQHVLTVGMTYLNTEDEAEQMAKGEKIAKPFGFKKSLPKE
jgi:nitrate reductase NapAB chaperone NapD